MAFTEKELKELRRFDALIDASPMTYRDYIISDFIEDILFPELEKQRAEAYRRYQRRKNQAKAYAQAYHCLLYTSWMLAILYTSLGRYRQRHHVVFHKKVYQI